MSDATGSSSFQRVYDALVRVDDSWIRPFNGQDDIAEAWARTAIDRLAVMVAGEPIEFTQTSIERSGFTQTATALLFTRSRLLELSPTSLSGRAFDRSSVTAISRTGLLRVELTELDGDSGMPWGIELELTYRDRVEPIRICSRTEQHGETAPVCGFMPSLLADLPR